MNLFKYPNPTERWLEEFNLKVETGRFYPGKFSVAIDVFKDGTRLFTSYDNGESMIDWQRRNYPQIESVSDVECAMGINVPGIGRFPVPTRYSFTKSLSLNSVREIMRAAMAVAQYPHTPDLSMVPTENSMRVRMHNTDRSWYNFKLYDQYGVAIRAIVGSHEADAPATSHYEASVLVRDGSKLTMRERTKWEYYFDAALADLSDSAARRAILREAKAGLGFTGDNGAVIKSDENGFVWRAGHLPYNLTVIRAHDYPVDNEPETKGLDI